MKNIYFILFSLLIIGCKSQVKLNSSSDQKFEEEKVEDNFDKAGKSAASGSRWVWNESKKAYEWTFSDKNKKKAKEAWQSAKDYVNKE